MTYTKEQIHKQQMLVESLNEECGMLEDELQEMELRLEEELKKLKEMTRNAE